MQRIVLAALAFVAAVCFTLPSAAGGSAQERVIHTFYSGNDGSSPAGLSAGASGVFFGVTQWGGTIFGGTVFELTPHPSGGYKKTIIYSFGALGDGYDPTASPIVENGSTLYGTTFFGGPSDHGGVYKLRALSGAYQESLIYAFAGGSDGMYPQSGLVEDSNGALYGTTIRGGSGSCMSGCGTVYELSRPNKSFVERILYRFQGGSDGASPASDVLLSSSGDIFGTTQTGGAANDGTIYVLIPGRSGYSEQVLHSFVGGADGALPTSGLVADAAGDLFGVTAAGGSSGDGTVYELTPNGPGYDESVIYSFAGGTDGIGPTGTLLMNGRHALIGSTASGGGTACGGAGCGTIFELAPSGGRYAESVLYRFQGPPDGSSPESGVVRSQNGDLLGTTTYGGIAGCTSGCGTIFKLAP